MNIVRESVTIGDRELTFEVGRLAQQATASVLLTYGDTTVLVTVVSSKPRADLGYFPLSVEFAERLYAGGRIKGSRWVKREGRPSDESILAARLIDRSIRPLFPKEYKNDVQVIVTVLSIDTENDPDILGIIGASAALSISPIPWNGPVGATRLGFVTAKEGTESHFLVNPGEADFANSEMDLVVSATKDKVHMIEAGAREVPEEIMNAAIVAAKAESQQIIEAIKKLVKKVGQKKVEVLESDTDKELIEFIKGSHMDAIDDMIAARVAKEGPAAESTVLAEKVTEKFGEVYDAKALAHAVDVLMKKRIRQNIMESDKRPDGRALTALRPLSAEIGILPRTHGSAIFSRGETQALTVTTLGAPSMELLIESATGEESKRYIHHYNFPPYSVGETGRFGSPNRREIGHGALAERALVPVIPDETVFPYTIRLVSEIMSSNGSTSMASVVGSTLSLMDAGVPITSPVAGISVGLVTEGDKYKLLTDIIGLEDFNGDMDFKVAGTKKGVTAIQLDVKVDGITDEMTKETFDRAHTARMTILELIEKTIAAPRAHLSKYAPKVRMFSISPEKIGEVIGSGGRTIKKIIAVTECEVNIDDDGKVTVTGINEEMVDKAVKWVEDLIREIGVGESFTGEVKRILPFGMFVEILPGREGMVHVSQMADEYVNNPADLFTIGQEVTVRVREIDEQGRVNLTMLDHDKEPERRESSDDGRPPRGDRGGFDRRSGGPRRPRY